MLTSSAGVDVDGSGDFFASGDSPARMSGELGISGYCDAIEASIDASGRLVVPKPLRDALGLTPGATVDISLHGAGLTVTPGGRTARLVEEDGHLVATAPEGTDPPPLTDEDVFRLIDAGRR